MVYRRFRVREEIFRAILYIEWKLSFSRTREELKYIEDEIISESLSKIEKEIKHIHTSEYGKERDLIGFTLQQETLDRLYNIHKKSNIYVGELIETCIYLYYLDHFKEEDIKLNRLRDWGIKLLRH